MIYLLDHSGLNIIDLVLLVFQKKESFLCQKRPWKECFLCLKRMIPLTHFFIPFGQIVIPFGQIVIPCKRIIPCKVRKAFLGGEECFPMKRNAFLKLRNVSWSVRNVSLASYLSGMFPWIENRYVNRCPNPVPSVSLATHSNARATVSRMSRASVTGADGNVRWSANPFEWLIRGWTGWL